MLDTRGATHAHEDELELYVRGQLEPAPTAAIEAHLIGCEVCRDGLRKSLGVQLALEPIGQPKAEEKYQRSEPRFNTGDKATFQELSPLSLDRQEVTIVDISKNGLGIQAAKPVLPGTIVQVRIKTSVELGEVRHCSMRGVHGFRIGIRLHRF